MLNPRLSTGVKFACVLILAGFTSSCWFRKSPQVFTPPPPQAQPPAPAAKTPTLPAPPQIAGDPNATIPPATPNAVPEAPAPPAPKPAPKKGPVPTAPPRVTTPPAPTEQQTPPPRLGPLLSPDQSRDYNRVLDESLDGVKKILAALAKKNLTPEQAETVNRISTFQKQAEEEREPDLVTAANLAKRAYLLAQDLQVRVQ